jgi:hypothetical protein
VNNFKNRTEVSQHKSNDLLALEAGELVVALSRLLDKIGLEAEVADLVEGF